jgi:hypothetical protein
LFFFSAESEAEGDADGKGGDFCETQKSIAMNVSFFSGKRENAERGSKKKEKNIKYICNRSFGSHRPL